MASFELPARLGHGVTVLRGKVTVIILDFCFCFTKLETVIFGNASATDRRPGKSKKLGKQRGSITLYFMHYAYADYGELN